jgi:parallel beta-helix repeat protein
LVSQIPSGSGIIVMSGDDVVIEDNVITGNNNAGIIVTSQDFVTEIATDTGSDPNPDRVQIRDNIMLNNGADPEGEMKLPHADQALHHRARHFCLSGRN